MALITKTCSSRGASVTFTMDDVTVRVTRVDIVTVGRSVRIIMFNLSGGIARDITTQPNTTIGAPIDEPARLVEIVRPDLSVKSYISPPFAVFF